MEICEIHLPDEMIIHILQYNFLPYMKAVSSYLNRKERDVDEWRISLFKNGNNYTPYILMMAHHDEAVRFCTHHSRRLSNIFSSYRHHGSRCSCLRLSIYFYAKGIDHVGRDLISMCTMDNGYIQTPRHPNLVVRDHTKATILYAIHYGRKEAARDIMEVTRTPIEDVREKILARINYQRVPSDIFAKIDEIHR